MATAESYGSPHRRPHPLGDDSEVIEAPHCRRSTAEEVAYHEAGHVVVGHRLGLDLVDVDVLSDREGGHGHTNFRPPTWFGREGPLDQRGREFAGAVVVTFLAGTVAEARHAGFANGDAGGFDLDAVVREWLLLLGTPAEVENLLTALDARARQNVGDPTTWAAIEKLAAALRRQRRMTAGQALAAAGLAA